MKKKYFSPEMEELELDEPIVLSDQETSQESEDIKDCDTDGEA
jgi:hypothetical protein